MPCIVNLFESVLNNRLSFKKYVYNDIDPVQVGFRSNCRTTDKYIYTLLVAFTKATNGIIKDIYLCKIIVSILKCVFFGMWTNIIKDGDVNKII